MQVRLPDTQTGEPIAKAVVAVRDRQRETVTDAVGRFRLLGSYRVTPTLNLGTRYRHGSGFPVAGFYEGRPACS